VDLRVKNESELESKYGLFSCVGLGGAGCSGTEHGPLKITTELSTFSIIKLHSKIKGECFLTNLERKFCFKNDAFLLSKMKNELKKKDTKTVVMRSNSGTIQMKIHRDKSYQVDRS